MARVEGEGVVRLAVKDGVDEPAEVPVRSRLHESPYAVLVHSADKLIEEYRARELPGQKRFGLLGVGRVRLAGAVRVDGHRAFG